jgi:plastocyanin
LKRVHLRSATVWLTILAAGALALGVLGAALLWPEPAAAQGTAQPIAVEMGERGAQYYFAPNELTVPAGAARFTIRNNGARRHNFVIEALNMRTPDVDAGASYEATFTFANPGTYDYICDLPTHAARGMTGRIVVTAAGAAPAPAAQATAPAPPGAPTTAAPATQATAPAAQATRPAQTTPGAAGAATASSASAQGVSPGGLPLFVSLAIHIPAAVSWLGVVLYQAVVGAVPFLTVAQRADLLRRPRWLIVAVIPLFFITGTYQTIFNPFVTLTSFETAEAFRATSPYAQALFWKHGFVLLSMALTLTVTFWLAPRLARAATAPATAPATGAGPAGAGSVAVSGEGAPDPAAGRVSLLAWANVAACLALLLCVSVMVFQLH